MKKVGEVTHHYGKIGVVIVELSDNLKVGDRIKFEGKGADLEQAVDSMEVEHKAVREAKSGDVVGLKVSGKVSEGAVVYSLE